MDEYKQVHHQPTKIIILSELTIKEKELFYQMMISNKCKFNKLDNNKYITNIRLLAPYIKKYYNDSNNSIKNNRNNMINNKDYSNYSISFQDRLTKLKYDGFITITIINPNDQKNTIECPNYPRFISLIANNNDIVRPKFRPFTW